MHGTRLRPNASEGSRARQVFVRVFFPPGIRDLRVNHGSAASAKLTAMGARLLARDLRRRRRRGPRARGARAAVAGGRPQLAVGDVRRQHRRHRAARLRRSRASRHRPYARPLLGIGLCGALTTFSTLQLEALELADNGHAALGAAYAADEHRGRPASLRADRRRARMRPARSCAGGRRRDGRSVDRRRRRQRRGAVARFLLHTAVQRWSRERLPVRDAGRERPRLARCSACCTAPA